jgi:glycosyltransferase involved in cell wall biosynthesis
MNEFEGRAGIQQRVLPGYRASFFDALAAACTGGVNVFAGQPRPREAIETTSDLKAARYTAAANRHLFGGPFYLCRQPGITAWLESWEPDVLVVEANPRNLNTPDAVRWMQSRNRPAIGWGLGPPRLGGRTFLHSLDALIAYGRKAAQQYQELGIPAERIFVAPNAAAPRPAARPSPRPLRFDARPTILFVGRLQARKRIDNLLAACAALPEDIRPRLIIVGDGPERKNLERLAQRRYPQAEFLGARFGPELVQCYALADLFVLPGTGGLAVQQAMAYALPVIVAQGDGTQGDLVRPENGWLVPPGDTAALAGAIRNALSDPARLRGMGNESYRITAEEINLERMVAGFLEAFEYVSGQKRHVTLTD